MPPCLTSLLPHPALILPLFFANQEGDYPAPVDCPGDMTVENVNTLS
jgi:hypothetical protein